MSQGGPPSHGPGLQGTAAGSLGPGPPGATDPRLGTEHIQKILDDNQQLIVTILEHQDRGRLSECLQFQSRLQQNLMFLAAVADQQPIRTPQGLHATPQGGTSLRPHRPANPVSQGGTPIVAGPAPSAPAPARPVKAPARKWDEEEERKFQEAIKLFVHDGKAQLKAMAAHIGTRNHIQVRTHYQRWQKLQKQKLEREVAIQAQRQRADQSPAPLQPTETAGGVRETEKEKDAAEEQPERPDSEVAGEEGSPVDAPVEQQSAGSAPNVAAAASSEGSPPASSPRLESPTEQQEDAPPNETVSGDPDEKGQEETDPTS